MTSSWSFILQLPQYVCQSRIIPEESLTAFITDPYCMRYTIKLITFCFGIPQIFLLIVVFTRVVFRLFGNLDVYPSVKPNNLLIL